MDLEGLRDVLARLITVSQRQNERHQAIAKQFEQAATSLSLETQAMRNQSGQMTREVVSGVTGQVGGGIKQAVDRTVVPVHEMLQAGAQAIQREQEALHAEREAFKREFRNSIKLQMIGLVVCFVLAFVGIGAWGLYWKKEADRYQVTAEKAKAVSEADTVTSGDGLYANVDDDAPRLGDQKQYRLVKPRY